MEGKELLSRALQWLGSYKEFAVVGATPVLLQLK